MIDGMIQWHPAFYAALQIELEQDADVLEFKDEFPLSKKPMSIDTVVVKKETAAKISKNIGHIFRKHNIVQYKSPNDYLSIRDFYKTYGYACFYISDVEQEGTVMPEEVTLTYVCSHYPNKLIRYLKQNRRMKTIEYDTGIIYLTGDQFPIQIIVTRALSPDRNYWMSNLRTDLKAGGEIRELIARYELHRRSSLYQAVIDAVLRANWEETEVEKKMCGALEELFAKELKEMRERGLADGKEQGIELGMAEGRAQGMAQGMAQGRAAAILELLRELGTVPENLEKIILEQTDTEVLKKWLKIAAKAESVDEFKSKM